MQNFSVVKTTNITIKDPFPEVCVYETLGSINRRPQPHTLFYSSQLDMNDYLPRCLSIILFLFIQKPNACFTKAGHINNQQPSCEQWAYFDKPAS